MVTYTYQIQCALPRDIKESDTVAVEIKKRLCYKNAYAFGRIRVHMVIKALKQLCKTMLYKMEKVKINKNWKQMFNEAKDAFASDSDEEVDNNIDENTIELVTKTLVHGFNDSHGIYDLQTNQEKIAPTEGYMPLGIFQDKYFEEMSFPTLFFMDKPDLTILQKNLLTKKILNGNYYTNTMNFPITTQTCFTKQFVLFLSKF